MDYRALGSMPTADLQLKLIQAIKQQDLASYQQLRYSFLPDGEPLVFDKVDFRQVDFSLFNCGFWVFNDCDLRNSLGLSGQPITINNCQAQGIDLRGVSTVIEANQSDLTGVVVDQNTNLANLDSSILTNCQMDEATAQGLIRAGAVIQSTPC